MIRPGEKGYKTQHWQYMKLKEQRAKFFEKIEKELQSDETKAKSQGVNYVNEQIHRDPELFSIVKKQADQGDATS